MSATLVLKGGRIVLADRVVRGTLVLEGDRIEAVLPRSAEIPKADRIVDVEEAYVAPGFVDVHLHGAAGVDVATADEVELERLSGWLASHGVTRFVPTLVPAPLAELGAQSERLASWISRVLVAPPAGAMPVGLHFEGPFVNGSRCGALHSAHFLDGGQRSTFFEAIGADRLAGLPARMITLAPEISGGLDLIRACVKRDFVVSLGHTEAPLETLDEAVRAGASHMTHFMNAMPPVLAREPGPIGWGLLEKRISVDVIADLQHVDATSLRLVVANKTPTRVALISDAVAPAGLGDGTFTLWGERIEVRRGRTSNAAGGLAGSVTTLGGAVRNMLRLGHNIVDVARMASTVPARVLGLEAFGAIAPGKIADVAVFRDEVEPILTVVAGRVVHAIGPL